LMARVLSVLFAARFVPVFFLTMVFADGVALAFASTIPAPTIDLMGGLHHLPEDQVLADAVLAVQMLTFLTAPIWVLGALIGLIWFRPGWALGGGEAKLGPAPRPVLAFAGAAILAWIPLMIGPQREQQLRHRAETLLRSGRVAEALTEMSAHERKEYPPIWDPPPRKGYGESNPTMTDISAAMEETPVAPWVRDLFVAKGIR
jgi:hypothetical protein